MSLYNQKVIIDGILSALDRAKENNKILKIFQINKILLMMKNIIIDENFFVNKNMKLLK